MKNIYDTDPGEVYWAASDIGWTVGHSYTVYGPLLHGCTSVLYEGKPVGTPDAGAFWRVCAEHGVSTLFTAPTAFRAIRQQDPDGALIADYDLSNLRALFLAGERCDPETLRWAEDKLGIPVIDHYWQTETGWPVVANCIGIERFPVVPGSPTRAVPGWDVQVMDSDGNEAPAGDIGALVVKLPLPPGASPTLWNAEARYRETYLSAFPGYYQTADAGYIDENGYVFVMARTDDIINTAGHRLSTGAMEEVLAAHPDVAECAVVGVADELKGQLPVGFLVLKAGVQRPHDEIVAEVVQLVRDRIGPVAAFKSAVVVDRLPKTRSGKILRGTMRRIADGEPYTAPATIDDPAILDEIEDALQTIGYAQVSRPARLQRLVLTALTRTSELEEVGVSSDGEAGNVPIEEVSDAMIRRRTFREERARAAAALLSYLGHPCAATERTLVEAAHDLEAAAALREARQRVAAPTCCAAGTARRPLTDPDDFCALARSCLGIYPGNEGVRDDQGASRNHDVGGRLRRRAERPGEAGARRRRRAAALLGLRWPVDVRDRGRSRRGDRRGRRLARERGIADRRRRRGTMDIRGCRPLGRREPVGSSGLHRYASSRGTARGRRVHVRVGRRGSGRPRARSGG